MDIILRFFLQEMFDASVEYVNIHKVSCLWCEGLQSSLRPHHEWHVVILLLEVVISEAEVNIIPSHNLHRGHLYLCLLILPIIQTRSAIVPHVTVMCLIRIRIRHHHQFWILPKYHRLPVAPPPKIMAITTLQLCKKIIRPKFCN